MCGLRQPNPSLDTCQLQGANDLICPPSTALELHRAWPEMELRVCAAAGHSMYSAQLQAEVLRATDAFRSPH